MRVFLAYLGVALIWSTTPLGIKWSSVEVSYVFGVTARMSIGAVCLLLLMLLARRPLALRGKALTTHVAVAVQLYGSMMITYWGAQFIPSGWLSVIYGLSPFMTAFMAAAFLKERSLGWGKLCSYALGTTGLVIMFSSALDVSAEAVKGVAALLLATFLHAASAVWVKQIGAGLPALTQISGGMLLSLPLYWCSWYWLDQGMIPADISQRGLWAILYLGVIATPLGFALYYYVLARLPATNVAMINLLTPVLSLLLGYWVNQEPLSVKVAIGTGLIMLALALHTAIDHRQSSD